MQGLITNVIVWLILTASNTAHVTSHQDILVPTAYSVFVPIRHSPLLRHSLAHSHFNRSYFLPSFFFHESQNHVYFFSLLINIIISEEVKIGSNSYEKVKTFKYLGSLLTNQNSIQEEIKCRLKAGNSCYY